MAESRNVVSVHAGTAGQYGVRVGTTSQSGVHAGTAGKSRLKTPMDIDPPERVEEPMDATSSLDGSCFNV